MLRTKYLRQLDALDLKLDALASTASTFDDDRLAAAPAEGVWSPTQLLFHLRKSEQMSFLYVKKKLSYDPEIPKVGLKAKAMCSLLGVVMKSSIKMPAPKGVGSESMPDELRASVQIEEWKQLRSDLRIYLQELPEKWLDRVVYKHPYAGRLTFGQMLTFFDLHFDRHRRQFDQRLAMINKI